MRMPEEILESLFALLPEAKFSNNATATINFGWGSQKDLNKYLKLKGSKRKYPLIWLVNSTETENVMAKTIDKKCRLLIAINSEKMANINPTIWDSDFKITLNPIKDNVLIALDNSGATQITNVNNIGIERVPNYPYEGSEETQAIDIWNVIVLDVDVRFNDFSTCFNTIQFNN